MGKIRNVHAAIIQRVSAMRDDRCQMGVLGPAWEPMAHCSTAAATCDTEFTALGKHTTPPAYRLVPRPPS